MTVEVPYTTSAVRYCGVMAHFVADPKVVSVNIFAFYQRSSWALLSHLWHDFVAVLSIAYLSYVAGAKGL